MCHWVAPAARVHVFSNNHQNQVTVGHKFLFYRDLDFYVHFLKIVSNICSSVQDFSHGIMGLAESTTYPFTAMQTLVIPCYTKGFSCIGIMVVEKQEISLRWLSLGLDLLVRLLLHVVLFV